MQVVEFAPLVSRLNTSCRGALENAAGTCLSRTHYEITVEHLMARLLEDPMGDIQLILKQAGIDPGRVMRALDQTIESFKTGNGGKPQFSPLLPELFADGWLIASVELFENRIRSGALFAAFISRLSFYGIDSYTKLLDGLNKEKVMGLLGQVAATSREAGESGPMGNETGSGAGAAAQAARALTLPMSTPFCAAAGSTRASSTSPRTARRRSVTSPSPAATPDIESRMPSHVTVVLFAFAHPASPPTSPSPSPTTARGPPPPPADAPWEGSSSRGSASLVQPSSRAYGAALGRSESGRQK